MTDKESPQAKERGNMKDIFDSVAGCGILLLLIAFPIACLIFMMIIS